MPNKIGDAIFLLKKAGYLVCQKKRNLFIIKYKDELGEHYSIRRQRYSNRNTQWPKGATIAEIDSTKLKWEFINE